jgi:hypothetical protein
MTNMGYQLELNRRQIGWLLKALKPDKKLIAGELGKAVKTAGVALQTQAVRNVSGYPVVYEGGAFRVRVQTGALKGSITLQYPYGDEYKARVYVNGTHTASGARTFTKPKPVSDYAGAIEWGHGPIDLKKTMQGKIVPFFSARSDKATGPYAATGVRQVKSLKMGSDGVLEHETSYQSQKLNEKLAAKGKPAMRFKKIKPDTGGSYFIAFRTVGKTGWIIPAAKPRPFMKAALSNIRGQAEGHMIQAPVDALTPKPL